MKPKLFLALYLISLLSSCSYYQRLAHDYSCPSDSVLEQDFFEQKEVFDNLVSMFIEDSKGKTQHYWIGREENFTLDNLSIERKQKYLELMNKLGILSIGRNYEEPEIINFLVTSDSKGIGYDEIETDMKGYSYSPEKVPSEMVNFGETDFWGSGYKKIDEDWYIFHETRSGKGE